jgi:predicted RNA-binding protein YlqC (UPF0109 family)
MVDVVEVIVKALVDNPDEVTVEETDERNGTVYISVTTAPGDAGKIIGKYGRIANAIRAVANADSAREGLRCNVDIESR